MVSDKEAAIEGFFHVTKETAKDTFRQLGTFQLGMCLVLDRSCNIHQIPVPMDGRIHKDLVALTIKAMAKVTKPLAIVFISECWMTARNIDDKKAVDDFMTGKTSVSEQADKTECIMIVQETPDSSQAVMIPIMKGNKGNYYGDEIIQPNIAGRFTNFFRS